MQLLSAREVILCTAVLGRAAATQGRGKYARPVRLRPYTRHFVDTRSLAIFSTAGRTRERVYIIIQAAGRFSARDIRPGICIYGIALHLNTRVLSFIACPETRPPNLRVYARGHATSGNSRRGRYADLRPPRRALKFIKAAINSLRWPEDFDGPSFGEDFLLLFAWHVSMVCRYLDGN